VIELLLCAGERWRPSVQQMSAKHILSSRFQSIWLYVLFLYGRYAALYQQHVVQNSGSIYHLYFLQSSVYLLLILVIHIN